MAQQLSGWIGLIIPTYGHFHYARRAVLSAFRYTTAPLAVLIVDDASPGWKPRWYTDLLYESPAARLSYHRFGENGGLTRSWNHGLTWFRDLGVDYICPSNSDVIFTPGWDEGLRTALDQGYWLVGPLSNNPGVTNPKNQEISYFFPGYKLTDDPSYLARLAAELRRQYLGQIRDTNVNGFCFMSTAQKWWQHSFDDKHVFNPQHRMTFNEDELQRRWRGKLHLPTGACMDSFVFHYRAVTRGGKAQTGKWMRNKCPDSQV